MMARVGTGESHRPRRLTLEMLFNINLSMSARGRPRGPRKVLFALRLRPELKDHLKALSVILEGRPPINGIIELAIERYVGEKLQDPDFREAIDRVIGKRVLRVVGRASRGDS